MQIELINTGSELMLGRVLNSHQQWLCRQLADRGYVVSRQVAVDDSALSIQHAVRQALAGADLIITTGGLGPTNDDRTRDLIAQLLKLPLREEAGVLKSIEILMAKRGRPLLPQIRVQALIPEGARVLPNANGTAPGIAIRVGPNPFRESHKTTWLIMLPGPPRELRPLFLEHALPLIYQELPPETDFVCRTLRTTGLGESQTEARITNPLQPLVEAGLEVAYCARISEVDVRLTASGSQARSLVEQAEQAVREQMRDLIFGVDDQSLEEVIVRLLTERQATLALAESCTGGFIGHRLTNVPGASAVLVGGWITYSNEMKQRCLGVQSATLIEHGAVSQQTACEMAAGARQRAGTDYGLAVTGIAGPAGGTDEKPVGTAYIGLASPNGVAAKRCFNPVDRETFKSVMSQQALEQLRRALLGV